MNVANSIIKTLAFFDLFNHPLTNFELHKWLYSPQPVSLPEVFESARSLGSNASPVRDLSSDGVKETDGFFSLRDDSCRVRQGRAVINDHKFHLAQKAARLISWIPFVRLVAVCNTLSFGAVEEWSDIDFFIIAKGGRIWTVRFFITIVLSLFGLRRQGQKIRDRVCLSFFITDDNLDLESIALPSQWTPDESQDNPDFRRESSPDIYLIYWITQLIPLINREQTLEKFWQANLWVKKYLANFSFGDQLPDYRQIKIPAWVEKWRRFHEWATNGRLGDRREKILRWLQLRKITRVSSSRSHQGGTAVVISDQMLKFHEEDRREEYRRKWSDGGRG